MTSAWLLLADTLLILLLLLSFVLYFLSPPVSDVAPEHPVVVFQDLSRYEQNITFERLQKKVETPRVTLGEEEMRQMAEDRHTVKDIIEAYLFDVPLKKQLHTLSLKMGDPVFIRIFKSESLLEVWMRKGNTYEHVKNYFICAYSGGLGPKLKEGDRQSPEGFYKVTRSALNPKSKFHLSFNLGYPNAYDRVHHRTGSFLMVHGNCVSIGCYAMTDKKMEEIYALVEAALKKGQKFVPVHIFPFTMTEENMAAKADNKWFDFWMNLKEGYDYFEAEKVPPHIEVKNKRYEIEEK